MSNFNYQEYLRNNPLLKEEVKDQLITESQEVEVDEDARTDAEQEGYKDGFDDAKDDVKSALTKMKVSELKAKIKEQILAELSLSEADEDEVDVDIDVEDEVSVDVEEPTEQGGLSQDEQEIQNSLKLAYDNAIAIGDQKLADQIGNSITFFTRTHVVER
tara:strand:+ start:113 stop:592 length:480 start_codon:yes stop_codon:yes gene_type:complete